MLANNPFLRFDRTQRTGLQIDRLLRRLAVPLNEFLELNAIETLIELVRQEVGVTLLPLINGSNWQQSPQLRILPLPADLGPSARAIGMLERREHARQGITAAICAACHAPSRRARRKPRAEATPAHGPMDRAPASAWTGRAADSGAHRGIGRAVPAGFHPAGEAAQIGRIFVQRDAEVVPGVAVGQRPGLFHLPARRHVGVQRSWFT